MAHVTLDDGRELDVDDSDTGLLDYYRGINAKVEVDTVLVPPYTIDEHGNVVESPEPPVVATEVEYDPSDHNVDEVNEYLAEADEPTRDRIFELERAGKSRVGILEGPFAVFDPAEHSVDEVNAYLARPDVDDFEHQRVLDAERAGQARVGILH